MVISKATFADYRPKKIRTMGFSTNNYHVKIFEGDKLLFLRDGQSEAWLDDKHKAIAKALKALERALLKAV